MSEVSESEMRQKGASFACPKVAPMICTLKFAGCRLAGSVQFVLSATEGVMVKDSIALPI